jgi:predicted site-specific integrase-resolvase
MDNNNIPEPSDLSHGTSLQPMFPDTDSPFGNMYYRKEAARFLGVSLKTLDRYAEIGRLHQLKNVINGRIYYTEPELLAVLGSRLPQTKQVVLYCRSAVLGSRSNHGDSAASRLAEQVDRLSSYCVKAGIRVDKVIKDIGPGTGVVCLPGHDELLELVFRKKVSMVVIETPDRLARWGMGDIMARFLTWHGVELHVASPVLTREEYREEIKQDLADVLYQAKVLLGELS